MRLTITIDDIMVEIDDEQKRPTIDGIESLLDRLAAKAVEIYFDTLDDPITFTPEFEFVSLDDDEDLEDDA